MDDGSSMSKEPGIIYYNHCNNAFCNTIVNTHRAASSIHYLYVHILRFSSFVPQFNSDISRTVFHHNTRSFNRWGSGVLDIPYTMLAVRQTRSNIHVLDIVSSNVQWNLDNQTLFGKTITCWSTKAVILWWFAYDSL